MNIFDLHSAVVADYRDFVRSFFTVADERARAFVEQTLDAEARLRLGRNSNLSSTRFYLHGPD